MPIEKPDGMLLRKQGMGFDIIPRDTIDSLSCAESIAVYTYLLTRPQNWRIRKTDIMKRLGLGADRYKRAMDELKEKKIIVSTAVQDENGKLHGRMYWFYPATEVPENRASRNPEPRIIRTLKEQESLLKNKRVKKDQNTRGKSSRFVPPCVSEVRDRKQHIADRITEDCRVHSVEGSA